MNHSFGVNLGVFYGYSEFNVNGELDKKKLAFMINEIKGV
jgi:hypothetical protein